jgi:hypothetical protein
MKSHSPKTTRSDDAHAFLPDPSETGEPLRETDGVSFAEEYVASALSGESMNEDLRDEVAEDEEGGPFLVLDDEAQLPTDPEEENPEADGSEAAQAAQALRVGRWAARGA